MKDDVYKHDPAPINERRLARLNLRSPDYKSASAASGDIIMTPGDILAAISRIRSQALYESCRYLNPKMARDMTVTLALYVYTDDRTVIHSLWGTTLYLCGQILSVELTDADVRNEQQQYPGVLKRLPDLLIDDICRPALYSGVSNREWARLVGLGDNYKAWQSRWRSRYNIARSVLQEQINAINDQVSYEI